MQASANPVATKHWMHVDQVLASPSSDESEHSDDDASFDEDDTSFVDESETEEDFSEAYATSSEFLKETAPAKSAVSMFVNQQFAFQQTQLPSAPIPAVPTTMRAPIAAKTPGGGIFLSNAMRQFLTRNHSDSDLAGSHGRTDPIQHLLYRSESAEKLCSNDQSRMVFVHQDKPKSTLGNATNVQRPKDLLQELLGANGFTNSEPRSYKTLKDSYFLHVTPSMIASYDMALMTAVRSNDLSTIQHFYASGRYLQCCNRFHESILHTAARRGSTEVMDFLLHKVKLDLKVVCDSGRTPLHDACWTGRPNFAVITWILELCPDFLLVADNKNFVPLDYVPKESYQEWCDFLNANQGLLTPRVVLG